MNLQDQLDEQQETIRQLREMLRPLGSFPAHWRLSPLQSRLLAALCRNGELNVEAACVVASNDAGEMSNYDVVRQHLSRMNKKLADPGITIRSTYSRGYYLDPDSLIAARIGYTPAGRVEK